jgi:hypothetical protein
MTKRIFITVSFIATFALGFAFKTLMINSSDQPLKKATGIGGIFFKCKDPKKVRAWYQTHLGLNTNEYGAVLNGDRVQIQQKKALRNGVRLMKNQNILRKNL